MKVSELIEKLQQLDQEALVNCYGGYDFEYGEQYSDLEEVLQEPVGWDDDKQKQIMEVFLK